MTYDEQCAQLVGDLAAAQARVVELGADLSLANKRIFDLSDRLATAEADALRRAIKECEKTANPYLGLHRAAQRCIDRISALIRETE